MAVQAGTGFSSALSTVGYSSGIDCSGLEVSRKSAPRRGHLEVPRGFPIRFPCCTRTGVCLVTRGPIFTMLNTLRVCLPASAVLENILGIRIVLD